MGAANVGGCGIVYGVGRLSRIDELALQEDNLLDKIYSLECLMEERSAQIENAGLFSAYREIYEQYAQLSIQQNNLEALKRALFLQWYAVSEPNCFTGLSDFSKNTQLQVLAIVDLFLAKQINDPELTRMIEWYYQISDYYFDYFFKHATNLSHLQTRLQYAKPQQNIAERGKAFSETISGRGQMSKYWKSIIHSSNNITNE